MPATRSTPRARDRSSHTPCHLVCDECGKPIHFVEDGYVSWDEYGAEVYHAYGALGENHPSCEVSRRMNSMDLATLVAENGRFMRDCIHDHPPDRYTLGDLYRRFQHELPELLPSRVSESMFVNDIVGRFNAHNRTWFTEVRTPDGRIDLWLEARPRGQPTIIEAKVHGDPRTVGAAIGQLLAYRQHHPRAALAIAVAAEIRACMLPVLEQLDIKVWDTSWWFLWGTDDLYPHLSGGYRDKQQDSPSQSDV